MTYNKKTSIKSKIRASNWYQSPDTCNFGSMFQVKSNKTSVKIFYYKKSRS